MQDQTTDRPVTSGDTVTYLGHRARVIHVGTTAANIYFDAPVPGMVRQPDVYLYALRPAAGAA